MRASTPGHSPKADGYVADQQSGLQSIQRAGWLRPLPGSSSELPDMFARWRLGGRVHMHLVIAAGKPVFAGGYVVWSLAMLLQDLRFQVPAPRHALTSDRVKTC